MLKIVTVVNYNSLFQNDLSFLFRGNKKKDKQLFNVPYDCDIPGQMVV